MEQLKLKDLTYLERFLLAMTLGFGLLAYGVLFLGLLGLLFPVAIWGLWLGCALLTWRYGWRLMRQLPGWLRGGWDAIRSLSLEGKAVVIILAILVLLNGISALAPPWETDALLYHLEVPRQFLQAGRILPMAEFWAANYPMTVEMLYTAGVAIGQDSLPKLIHFTLAVLLVLATFAFARRCLDDQIAVLAVIILVGIPIFPFWATLSHNDMGWALFEFLGFYALVAWWQSKVRNWLLTAGALTGLAMGSKYFALGTAAIFAGMILWRSRRDPLKSFGLNLGAFALPVILVASPWYLKNWVWLDNPIYPLELGDIWSTGGASELWTAYMRYGFGTGRSLRDYLLLPWNLYFQYTRFGTFGGTIEIPSLLFPLIVLYPFIRKRGIMDLVAAYVLVRFAYWSLGVQQTRYLLPIYPQLSLLTAYVIYTALKIKPWQRWTFVVSRGLLGSMLIVTLVYTLLAFIQLRPLGVVTGNEPRSRFLARMVTDYEATGYIQERLIATEKALMMWDGRGYYCDERCLPDTEHSQWTELVLEAGSVEGIAAALKREGVTHLLFSLSDADFMLQHDPTGQHEQALNFFLDEFHIRCTEEVYRDDWARVYELTCPGS